MPADGYTSGAIEVRPQETGFGAEIIGVDLTRPLPAPVLEAVKAAWLKHAVVAFPDQPLSLDELEAFTLQMGSFGDDPFIAPMPGRPNVLELRREPDEKAPNFGGGWHSDWSFQPAPPAATILRSEVVPPVGGDTLFIDSARAYEDLSPTMKSMLAPLRAIHSATRPYGAQGLFARESEKRTMTSVCLPNCHARLMALAFRWCLTASNNSMNEAAIRPEFSIPFGINEWSRREAPTRWIRRRARSSSPSVARCVGVVMSPERPTRARSCG